MMLIPKTSKRQVACVALNLLNLVQNFIVGSGVHTRYQLSQSQCWFDVFRVSAFCAKGLQQSHDTEVPTRATFTRIDADSLSTSLKTEDLVTVMSNSSMPGENLADLLDVSG